MIDQELKILLVEDTLPDAELMLSAVEGAGIKHRAQRVENEVAFRQALKEFCPDIILSDFSLPHFDGLLALAIARGETPDTPFIYVSGMMGEERAIESLKSGATDYVLKSNLQRLAPAIHRAMRVADERNARKRAEDELKLAASALENTADAVLIADSQRRAVSVNRAFCAMTGYTLEESRGKSPELLRSGQHDIAFYDAIWTAVKQSGHWQGEVWGRRKNGEVYPQWISITEIKNDAGHVTHYVSVSNDISKHKQYEERLEFLAHHDPLTRLPNRAYFLERLEATLVRCHRTGHSIGLFFIDLDRFKTINDTLGHAVGDRLLHEFGQRLISGVRESDTVCRLGGDEFIILLDELRETSDAAPIAQKLLDVLNAPFVLDGKELFVSASIGISCYPKDGSEGEALIQTADLAMYRAKQFGRNNYQFFSPEMNQQAHEVVTMTNNLRQALSRNELTLVYQPLVNLTSGVVTGYEALVRWENPELGVVLPARFLSLAEETGLIGAIDEWVLDTACRQAKEWQERGVKPLQLSINLSSYHFARPGLVNRVAAALTRSGLDPTFLVLEITEGMVMQQTHSIETTLAELSKLGVRIALDDFGVGYSSLGYLKRHPIHYLKIDQSFVRDIPKSSDDCAIVMAIIAMAKSLKVAVIAEGVETNEQAAFLKTHGCVEGQGNLFSAPLRPQEIERMFNSKRVFGV